MTKEEFNLKSQIAWKEVELNLKYQIGKIKEFTQIGYEFEKGFIILILILPIELNLK